MKKLSQKGVLLFVGAMAAFTLAMPSPASAATWGVFGTEHTLQSSNFGFTATAPVVGAVSSSCSNSTWTVDVSVRGAFPSTLTVTSASFSGCTATGPSIGTCTATTTATPNPNPDWRVTAPTTSNVQIHGMVVDMTFDDNFRSALCNADGLSATLTGTLGGGQWTGNGVNQHEVVYSDDEGMVMHSVVGTAPVTARGTFRDVQQTLTLN